MIGGEDLSETRDVAFGLLKHGELVSWYGLVFVNSALDVPASEIAAVGARERSGAEAPNRCALPVAIIDMATIESGLLCARMIERSADGTLPGGFGNVVART